MAWLEDAAVVRDRWNALVDTRRAALGLGRARPSPIAWLLRDLVCQYRTYDSVSKQRSVTVDSSAISTAQCRNWDAMRSAIRRADYAASDAIGDPVLAQSRIQLSPIPVPSRACRALRR